MYLLIYNRYHIARFLVNDIAYWLHLTCDWPAYRDNPSVMEGITFVTGNKKKLAEVNHILGDKISLKSHALDCKLYGDEGINIC